MDQARRVGSIQEQVGRNEVTVAVNRDRGPLRRCGLIYGFSEEDHVDRPGLPRRKIILSR
jgi:hypothetical protein